MKFKLNNEKSTFNICRSMKHNGKLQTVSAITYKIESGSEERIGVILGVESLAEVMMTFESYGIEHYD